MQARATDVAPFWMRCIITGRRWHVAIANGFQSSILPSGFSITLHIRFRQACHIVQQRPPPVPSPLSSSCVCVCVCVRERERERERESRLSASNNIFKYTKLKKKSSCKESINNTFKSSSLYPIIIYLFILLLHTHTLQKSAANA